MGLDQIPHNFITARLEDVVRWGRRNSVFPATFGLACCALEMMATGAAHYDLARFGMEVFRASPRQADLMIVAGRVSQKMAPVLRQVYDQMVEPKWVISMGVCASSGGMFNNYAIVQGVDQIVPVDVYVPGCPPGPETLMHGILTLHEQIRTGELLRRREASPTGGAAHRTRHREPPAPAGILSTARTGDAMADDTAREEDHEAEPRAPTAAPIPDDEVAAAIVERFAGSVFVGSHGQPVVYVDRAVFADVARVPARRGAVHDVRRHHGRRPLARRRRATRSPGVAPERFEVVANFLSHTRNRRIRVICEVPADDPTVPSLTRVYPGHELPRARDVRPLRHRLRRSSRPHAHPHARRLGRPPAAQGRPGRARPGDVQGRPAARDDRR